MSVVTLRIGTWDYHGNDARAPATSSPACAPQLPLLDQSIPRWSPTCMNAGLDKEVAVLVWGEFGGRPRVNKVEGRDHWPDAGFALFAGGGLRTGQVVGETDAKAERPKTRALVRPGRAGHGVPALGIDPTAKLPDFSGRPMRCWTTASRSPSCSNTPAPAEAQIVFMPSFVGFGAPVIHFFSFLPIC